MSPEAYQICYYWLFISLLAIKDKSYCEALPIYFLYLLKLRQIVAVMILWLEETPSKEEYASQFKVLFIYFLFMHI